MLANSYVGVVEQEVPRLVVSRARRLRIGRDEIDDLQQQIVPKLSEFQYDASRSNGASRTTAMTGLIDRQIKAYLRAKYRYQKRLERLQVMSGASGYSRPVWPHHVTQPEPVDLRMDLAAAMATLSARDRRICQGLADGLTVKVIAQQLGCGRDTISRAIVRIRAAFTAAGLRAWIDPDYSQDTEQA
jgi:RNA polymerase sigma factor (sigma-70 family)